MLDFKMLRYLGTSWKPLNRIDRLDAFTVDVEGRQCFPTEEWNPGGSVACILPVGIGNLKILFPTFHLLRKLSFDSN